MLRKERERAGRTLEEVSTQTKIRLSYLQAIENDRLDTIPGGFFSRSFVRQYAQSLGVDLGEVERLLEVVTVPPTDTVPVEKIYEDYRPTAGLQARQSVFVSPDHEAEPEMLHEAAYLKPSHSGTFWVGVAMVLIAGSGAFLTWQHRPEIFENVFAQSSGTVSPSMNRQSPAYLPSAPVSSPVPDTTTPAEAAAEAPVPEATTQASPVEVAVLAVEKSWVRLIVDGERVFGGVMEPGETRTLNGEQSAVVFTGNAGGLDFRYNGKQIGTAGPKGQVRTVVFSTENWEVRNQQVKKSDESSPASSDVVRAP